MLDINFIVINFDLSTNKGTQAMKTKYSPPPIAVSIAGKKKEKVTKAINLLESLREDLANHPDIIKTIGFLKEYRKDLEIL